jgi:hypothetical protein
MKQPADSIVVLADCFFSTIGKIILRQRMNARYWTADAQKISNSKKPVLEKR